MAWRSTRGEMLRNRLEGVAERAVLHLIDHLVMIGGGHLEARAAGFRIAACLPVDGPIAEAVEAGAELIIVHDGPPQPGPTNRGSAAAPLRLRRQPPDGPPVMGAEALLATLTP